MFINKAIYDEYFDTLPIKVAKDHRENGLDGVNEERVSNFTKSK